VLLNGRFTINGSILMRHGIILSGCGYSTMLTSSNMAAVGMIQLFDTHTGLTTVRDLTLWGNYTSGGSSHGIYYRNSTTSGINGNLGTYAPGNSPDSSHRILNVYIKAFTGGTRHGIWLDDNCRDTNVHLVRVMDCSGTGFRLTEASDSKFTQCITASCGIGYEVGGGSNQFIQCKTAYSDGNGWEITSSRAHLTGCHSQDSGGWGYYVSGAGTPTLSSCVADSNQRVDNSTGGFYLNNAGVYSGLDAYDRNQSAQRQTRGISLGSSIGTSYLTGKVSVPSGTNYVVGSTPSAGSYARIVRDGSTLYSVG
jgi:hypothetical protein